MTSISKSLPAFALVAVMLSSNAGIGFGPGTVWAQTASDLRCNQCVDRREIRKGAINFKRLQPRIRNQITALESVVRQRVPFYITLDGDGAEQTIVTNGALTLFARCRVDFDSRDRVQILATSTVDGWFAEVFDPPANGPFAAFEEVVVMERAISEGSIHYNDGDSQTSAAAPDGSFISITGEATALAVNVFDHDCLVAGTAFLIDGTP